MRGRLFSELQEDLEAVLHELSHAKLLPDAARASPRHAEVFRDAL
jgi:hypothetical protein